MCRVDDVTTFMYRLSWNLGNSTSWNPQGLSRPVLGLLYLYILSVYTNLSFINQKNGSLHWPLGLSEVLANQITLKHLSLYTAGSLFTSVEPLVLLCCIKWVNVSQKIKIYISTSPMFRTASVNHVWGPHGIIFTHLAPVHKTQHNHIN